MHKQTIVDQVQILRDGCVRVMFAKVIVNDDGTLAAPPAYHLALFEPDTDVADYMARINADLVSQGEAAVQAAEMPAFTKHVDVARTPEKVLAYTVQKAAILRAEEAARVAAAEALAKAAEGTQP